MWFAQEVKPCLVQIEVRLNSNPLPRDLLCQLRSVPRIPSFRLAIHESRRARLLLRGECGEMWNHWFRMLHDLGYLFYHASVCQCPLGCQGWGVEDRLQRLKHRDRFCMFVSTRVMDPAPSRGISWPHRRFRRWWWRPTGVLVREHVQTLGEFRTSKAFVRFFAQKDWLVRQAIIWSGSPLNDWF